MHAILCILYWLIVPHAIELRHWKVKTLENYLLVKYQSFIVSEFKLVWSENSNEAIHMLCLKALPGKIMAHNLFSKCPLGGSHIYFEHWYHHHHHLILIDHLFVKAKVTRSSRNFGSEVDDIKENSLQLKKKKPKIKIKNNEKFKIN